MLVTWPGTAVRLLEEIERYEEAYKVLREAFEDEDLNLCDGPNTARRLLQAIDTIPWESGTAFLYTHYIYGFPLDAMFSVSAY